MPKVDSVRISRKEAEQLLKEMREMQHRLQLLYDKQVKLIGDMLDLIPVPDDDIPF